MTQEIKLEQLRTCPFCGGHPVMKIADDPFDNGFQIVRITCTQCHTVSNAYSSGKSAFSDHITTLEEAKQNAVKAWNNRYDAEKRREVFVQSLSVAQVAPIIEARRLYEYSEAHEIRFCKEMARVYGCVPKEGDAENLAGFLTTLYHYGRIQGIRQERARRKRGQQPCNKKR